MLQCSFCCTVALVPIGSLYRDVGFPVCLCVRGAYRPVPNKPNLLPAGAGSLSAGLQSSLLLSLYDQSEEHFTSQGLREKERWCSHSGCIYYCSRMLLLLLQALFWPRLSVIILLSVPFSLPPVQSILLPHPPLSAMSWTGTVLQPLASHLLNPLMLLCSDPFSV